uniref:Saposin B-type domain-containing protein n=1 Tax=Lepeophtheirus salmonis TaxID=72036 RepID=A0A0K2SVQ3_LEPSM
MKYIHIFTFILFLESSLASLPQRCQKNEECGLSKRCVTVNALEYGYCIGIIKQMNYSVIQQVFAIYNTSKPYLKQACEFLK